MVSQTPQMRVNAYDNFGIQYPATAMNPLVNQSAPDILSSLGSWVASAGPCIWPAATGGPLNAVAVSFLTTYPQTVGTHILAPNLPDVIDASMFYRRLISDHFPIVAQFSLP